eukprot:scaffold1439_cov404-Prasinococcus_capsulatus_cf.AAC.61
MGQAATRQKPQQRVASALRSYSPSEARRRRMALRPERNTTTVACWQALKQRGPTSSPAEASPSAPRRTARRLSAAASPYVLRGRCEQSLSPVGRRQRREQSLSPMGLRHRREQAPSPMGRRHWRSSERSVPSGQYLPYRAFRRRPAAGYPLP